MISSCFSRCRRTSSSCLFFAASALCVRSSSYWAFSCSIERRSASIFSFCPANAGFERRFSIRAFICSSFCTWESTTLAMSFITTSASCLMSCSRVIPALGSPSFSRATLRSAFILSTLRCCLSSLMRASFSAYLRSRSALRGSSTVGSGLSRIQGTGGTLRPSRSSHISLDSELAMSGERAPRLI